MATTRTTGILKTMTTITLANGCFGVDLRGFGACALPRSGRLALPLP